MGTERSVMEAKFWLGSYCNGPGDRDGSLDEGGGE